MQQSLPKKYQNSTRKLSVKRSSAGLGLFTNEPIERKGFVIEYWGPIMTRKESDEKGGKYLFETSDNRVIDGTTRKNIARYINHSCKPNCEIEILKGRVYVFAKRKIEAGEELAYDYGKEYIDEYIKPFGCKCTACLS